MSELRKDCSGYWTCYLGNLFYEGLNNCERCSGYDPVKSKTEEKKPPYLKPCPFCGGEAEIKKDNTCMGHGDYGSCKWVKCKECGTSTKKYLCDGYYGCEMTDEELAEKWNNRV